MGPPAADEIEVTVVGPGFGESVLIHLGFGEWFIVDSCWDSYADRPAALSYLEQINVEAAVQVKGILATHWHDDHIGGISELLSTCSEAQFICAAALAKPEFLQLASLFNKNPSAVGSSGVTEIRKVFDLLHRRYQRPKYAIADRPIFTRMNLSRLARITALSPCDAEYHRFLGAVASLIPTAGETKYRCPDLNPNDLSVATWVKIEKIDVLLGADLEEHGEINRGWSAVLASADRPNGTALLFKVAHHGSLTGHHPGIWTSLLIPKAHSVLTPWNRGAKLPTKSDCDRLAGLSSKSFATSQATKRQFRTNKPSAVTKSIREANIKIVHAEPPRGLFSSVEG